MTSQRCGSELDREILKLSEEVINKKTDTLYILESMISEIQEKNSGIE